MRDAGWAIMGVAAGAGAGGWAAGGGAARAGAAAGLTVLGGGPDVRPRRGILFE